MTGLLELAHVSKSFSGLRAVEDVSFAVPEGQIVGLIGPNGAGKTTCFNVVAGVYRPDAGEVRFAGNRIDGWRPDQICRAGVGRTFQLVKPFVGLSVMENVIVGALNACASVREAKEKSAQVIEQLGLAPSAIRWRPRSRCPSASAWKSPAHSPPARASSCSTR
jgi:branched-chain amino acid transport system ATP-binding protein